MSAGPSPLPPAWMREIAHPPYPLIKFLKMAADSVLVRRLSGTARDVIRYIGQKAAVQHFTAEPGEVEVEVTMLELRQLTGMSKRCIEYAIEEIGPPRKISGKRLKKIQSKTPGVATVGKNAAQVTMDPRTPGVWKCRLSPENWSKIPLLTKTPRKAKTLRAGHSGALRMAALNARPAQPVAKQFPLDSAQSSGLEGVNGPTQQIAAQPIAPPTQPPAEYPSELRQISGEDLQPVAQPLYITRTSGEGPQSAAMHSGSPLRTPAQSDRREDAPLCSYPLCRKNSEQITTELARPAQSAPKTRAPVLAQLIAGDRILPLLECPNLGTCENLLDLNKMRGLPGPEEVSTFLLRHQDRSSWKNWGVVIAAVREDLMPWLLKTGWWKGEGIWSRRVPEETFYGKPLPDGPPPSVVREAEETPDPSPWMRIKLALRAQIAPQHYQDFVKLTEFLEMNGDDLVVLVPDQTTVEWMETEYGELVKGILGGLDLPVRGVVYRLHTRGSADAT
jgi:hypothetical protein